jgi:hypothetical protein
MKNCIFYEFSSWFRLAFQIVPNHTNNFQIEFDISIFVFDQNEKKNSQLMIVNSHNTWLCNQKPCFVLQTIKFPYFPIAWFIATCEVNFALNHDELFVLSFAFISGYNPLHTHNQLLSPHNNNATWIKCSIGVCMYIYI